MMEGVPVCLRVPVLCLFAKCVPVQKCTSLAGGGISFLHACEALAN